MGSLDRVRAEAAGCTRCDLYRNATVTVFGEGAAPAPVMLVGEQPGDQEDLQGRPFVGPAGQVLDRALAEARLDRRRVWLTDAVKHFRFAPRGKRRIHQKPDAGEIQACPFWLLREVELVNPRLVVAMGVTAAVSLTGRNVTIGSVRGQLRPWSAGRVLLVTAHPSAILRVPDAAAKEAAYRRFVDDLRRIHDLDGVQTPLS